MENGSMKSAPVKQEHKNITMDMTKGSPARLLLRFAMPLFIGNLLQQFYNLADTSIAGHMLGDQALAEIGATAALYSLITNFAFGMNNGLALTVSRNFGAGNEKKMKQAVCWMTVLSICTAFVLSWGFLLFQKTLLELLKIPWENMTGALAYLTVILAGIPLTMIYNLEAGLLQAVGNSLTPLCLLLFSSVLNVGLDIVFMGTLAMGVRGAAIATVLAQGVSAVLGFGYILAKYPKLRFTRKELHVSPAFAMGMFEHGVSMGLMSAIYNIGSVVLQSSITALGSVSIAAQVGGRRLAEMFYVPGVALGTSIATYSSQNYGAGTRSRIKKGIVTAIWMYGVWWLIALGFTIFFAPVAVKFITGTDNKDVIYYGSLYLRVSIPMIPPMAVLVILRSAFQGMQHLLAPLFCSGLELIGKVIFAIWLVPVWGYPAVCTCEPVTWVVCCAFILAALYLFRNDFRDDEIKEKVS